MIAVEYKVNGQKFLSVNKLPLSAIETHEPTKKETYENLMSEIIKDEIAHTKAIFGVSTIILKKIKVNEERFNEFIKVYGEILDENMRVNPIEYMGTFESTFNNMTYAILMGTFNKDSESFKQACKALGIKHTYKAINEFLERK